MGLTKIKKYANIKSEICSLKIVKTRKAKREIYFSFYFSLRPPRLFHAAFGGIFVGKRKGRDDAHLRQKINKTERIERVREAKIPVINRINNRIREAREIVAGISEENHHYPEIRDDFMRMKELLSEMEAAKIDDNDDIGSAQEKDSKTKDCLMRINYYGRFIREYIQEAKSLREKSRRREYAREANAALRNIGAHPDIAYTVVGMSPTLALALAEMFSKIDLHVLGRDICAAAEKAMYDDRINKVCGADIPDGGPNVSRYDILWAINNIAGSFPRHESTEGRVEAFRAKA